jgi:tetratricopeptide (TPR) repeat protein
MIANLRAAQELADSGRFAELLGTLQGLPEAELEESPGLVLLLAIATARLGDHLAGERWARKALRQARRKGDAVVEVRVHNVSGAIAFERGRIDEAGTCFSRGLAAAEAIADHATAGRCSNNLGNIAYLRGHYGPALGYYTMAAAAFERAEWTHGVAEVWHNVSAVHRKQEDHAEALEAAHRAVERAAASGDRNLQAQALAGRAQARLAAGDTRLALREIEEAERMHHDLGDDVRRQEDRRILANVLAARDEPEDAERILRDVIERADEHGRPLLRAKARRDLAEALSRRGLTVEARDAARLARVDFERMSAVGEVRRVDGFLDDCDGAG